MGSRFQSKKVERSDMIKTGTVLLGSNISLALLKMLRNVLLARLFTVEQFGIVSTFAVVFALFDMLGYLGLDRLMVQAKDGETPRLQATLHAIQVLRGILAALALFAAAAPMARLMGVPEIAWAFRVMAVVPFIQGLTHLDTSRLQRVMRFGPFVKMQLTAEAVTLLSIYPLFLVFGDYRAALFAFVLQYVVTISLSHLLAERGFRVEFDTEIMRRAVRFGWPLLLNAVLLFGIFQGDRIIIANRLGMVELGLFSLGFMLTLMAGNILAQTQQKLFLPKLAPLQDNPWAFEKMARIAVQSGLVIGLAVALGFTLLGPDLILIVFGEKYAGALLVMVWLAVMQAVRIAKTGISVVAVARGETLSSATANLVRVLLLPVAWLAVGAGGGMFTVIWLAIVGELLGLGVALGLLQRWLRVPLRGLVRALILWAACLLLIALDAVLAPPQPVVLGNFHPFQIVLLAACAAAVWGMHDLRDWVRGKLPFG